MKSSPRESAVLYNALSRYALKLDIKVAASHNSLFLASKTMWRMFEGLYLDQIQSYQQGHPVKRRPDNHICKSCKSFHISQRKTIDKDSDVILGKKFETCFSEFINQKLYERNLNLSCVRADECDMHMPDFKIVDNQKKTVLYFEFKFIFRPYITISKINPIYECYSHSLTLDVGDKLQKQRTLVEKIGIDNVVYVYWYDLPCVKGIFWLPANRVYELWDNEDNNGYQREVVDGDRNKQGHIRGAVEKLYLPLIEMSDFESLFDRMNNI